MPRYFTIYGAMRTGSNLLERSIGAFGDTVCYGEAYNPAFVGGPKKSDLLGWTKDRRDGDPLGLLRAMRDADPLLIPGFRLFRGHDSRVFGYTIADPDCARIVLRRDPVESFVSLQIARTTDQWLLRNARRRIAAKIHFDAARFDAYRTELDTHYAGLAHDMQHAGTGAFEIGYDDLTDHNVLELLAAHIGSSGQPPAAPPILRQNPTSMRRKVINYEEMCAHLGTEPEPDLDGGVVGPEDILVPEAGPYAIAPIDGPALLPMVALIQRIAARNFDAQLLGRGDLIECLARGTLYPRGARNEELADRRIFAPVCHPLHRLYGLIIDELSGPGWRHAPLRAVLGSEFGDLPEARSLRGEIRPDRIEQIHRIMTAVADLVRRALAGQGPLSGRASWRSQSAAMADYRQGGLSISVARLEDFQTVAKKVTQCQGLPALPPGQLKAVRAVEGSAATLPEALRDGALAQTVRQIWPEDYSEFGYDTNT